MLQKWNQNSNGYVYYNMFIKKLIYLFVVEIKYFNIYWNEKKMTWMMQKYTSY